VVTSLVGVEAPRKDKISERGENLLQNGILHFSWANRQKSNYKVRIYTGEKL